MSIWEWSQRAVKVWRVVWQIGHVIKLNQMLCVWLQRKTVKGVFWISVSKGISEAGGFVRLIFLAHLLSPQDFGVMGIALFALGVLDVFTQTGFDMALIQRRGNIGPYLDTAFTVQLVRGFILASVIWFAAPYVATFFDTPSASVVLQTLGIVTILRGLVNPAIVSLNRELDFAKILIWNLSETVSSLLVAIILAITYRNVWALVGASIAGQGAKTIVSYILVKYKPRLTVDIKGATDLGRFGIWVLASNVVVFLSLQGDNAFVGKVFGSTALGFYQMAFRISELPVYTLTYVISQIAFPMFSMLQSDKTRLKIKYIQAFQFLALTTGLIALLIFVFANQLILLLLGANWISIVAILRVLVIANYLRSMFALGGWLFYALGKPELNFYMNALRLFSMVVLIYPLSQYFDLIGVSIGVLVATGLIFPIYVRGVYDHLSLSIKEHLFPVCRFFYAR
jgi:PST family polysaccharide transporter